MNNPVKNYRHVQIQTATQEQLIVLMYEGAIRAIQTAKTAMPNKKYDVVSNSVIKAQDIITELMVSLKMEAGPVAQNLYRLYDYMNRRLIEANMKKSVPILTDVENMLVELLKTWEDLFKKTATPTAPSAAASPSSPLPGKVSAGGFSVSG